jgi:hypothetical protein
MGLIHHVLFVSTGSVLQVSDPIGRFLIGKGLDQVLWLGQFGLFDFESAKVKSCDGLRNGTLPNGYILAAIIGIISLTRSPVAAIFMPLGMRKVMSYKVYSPSPAFGLLGYQLLRATG